MSEIPSIHLVDDCAEVQDLVRGLLTGFDYELVVHADPAEFLREFRPRPPQCLVLGLRPPRLSGLEVLRQLVQRDSEAPVILIAAHGSFQAAVEAFRLGAFDFFEQPLDPELLLATIERAVARDRQREEQRREKGELLRRFATLTPRERQVFELLIGGGSSKSVALALELSKKTIDLHRANVMHKLGVSSLVELGRMSALFRPEPAGPLPRTAPASRPDAAQRAPRRTSGRSG